VKKKTSDADSSVYVQKNMSNEDSVWKNTGRWRVKNKSDAKHKSDMKQTYHAEHIDQM